MLSDRNQKGWIAIQQLLPYDEACLVNMTVVRDFDKPYELLRPIGSKYFRWIKVTDIVGKFHLRFMPKSTFRQMLKNKQVPKSALFVRDGTEEDFSLASTASLDDAGSTNSSVKSGLTNPFLLSSMKKVSSVKDPSSNKKSLSRIIIRIQVQNRHLKSTFETFNFGKGFEII